MPSRRSRDDDDAPQKRSPMPPPSFPMDSKSRKHREDGLDDLEEERQGPPVGTKPHTIRIVSGELTMIAQLNTTDTARELWHQLPISGKAKLWPDEIYFEIPVSCPPEEPQDEVLPGTVAYWPEGDCLCIILGKEPYSSVNVVGIIDGDPEELRAIEQGDEIRLDRVE